MEQGYAELTVLFEDPFWVGIYERREGRTYQVCKITFGAEPKDCEVWEFVLKHYYQLKFSPSVDAVVKKEATNPKRIQREARKQTAATGIGTKSQQALQLQREESKLERKVKTREQREEEKDRRYALRQEKKKAKHKGK